MHDLVRSMSLKITKGKNVVISGFDLKEIPNEGEWTKDPEKLPNSVSNLENLKALNLRYYWTLVYIPDLGKLKKLREFDLSGTGIKKVPQGMEELVNLRSLSLIEMDCLVILPEGLFLNFQLLQYLRLPFQIKAPAEEISSGVNKYYGPGFMYEANRNELILHQCDLKNEEKDDFRLENCEGLSNSLLDDFPRMNKPSSLKVLKISKCGEVECCLTNKQFLTANQELESRFLSLSNLEEIKLIELQNFIGLIQNIGAAIEPPLPQAAVFSSLQSLSIWGVTK
ncbi:hypothetical protein CDL12_02666 [Handroanthus impetiginosus]|uniref:Uncharacterized protein n=1 Tax=Handroanthus impetiginosus TaxID=429701 RepID=A0A2G9I4C1_9LAMI|nr:hypothetical protein CDL12_02666 [Handroanthus impetiginosus]